MVLSVRAASCPWAWWRTRTVASRSYRSGSSSRHAGAPGQPPSSYAALHSGVARGPPLRLRIGSRRTRPKHAPTTTPIKAMAALPYSGRNVSSASELTSTVMTTRVWHTRRVTAIDGGSWYSSVDELSSSMVKHGGRSRRAPSETSGSGPRQRSGTVVASRQRRALRQPRSPQDDSQRQSADEQRFLGLDGVGDPQHETGDQHQQRDQPTDPAAVDHGIRTLYSHHSSVSQTTLKPPSRLKSSRLRISHTPL